jgi:hypothetical protein
MEWDVKFDGDGAKFSKKMRMRHINCTYSFIGILLNGNCNTQTDYNDSIFKNHIIDHIIFSVCGVFDE